MVNKGKRVGDAKKKKQVSSISFFHNPNEAMGVPDPVQQFDILDGIEKEEKLKEKDIFEGITHPKKTGAKLDKKQDKRRRDKMEPNQVRGAKRGLEKKKVPKQGQIAKPGKYKG
tara:strand:- start:139 stop:480 length:342 start_codon:yes stop_codon:yes gene_type:complete